MGTVLDTTRPFTRRQALAAGISDKQLRGPSYRRILVGLYVDARVPLSPELMTRAALQAHPPDAVASHSSVARLLRAPVPKDAYEHVSVQRHDDRRQRLGVRCHVGALPPDDVASHRGIRVTAPHRLFLDMASLLPLVDLVVLGDWLVRKRLVTPESLLAYCRASSARNASAARRAAALVRRDVDSPMETRLRLLLVLAGLPEPTVNWELRDEHGLLLRRLDLAYPGVRLGVEYDGRVHVEDPAQAEYDHVRRGELEDLGWRLLVVTGRGVYRHPEETVLRVWRALRKAGWPNLADPSDAWRPHFT